MSNPGRFACMGLNIVASSSEWNRIFSVVLARLPDCVYSFVVLCIIYFAVNPTMLCACICWGTKSHQKMSLWSYNKLFQLFPAFWSPEFFIALKRRHFALSLAELGTPNNARARSIVGFRENSKFDFWVLFFGGTNDDLGELFKVSYVLNVFLFSILINILQHLTNIYFSSLTKYNIYFWLLVAFLVRSVWN